MTTPPPQQPGHSEQPTNPYGVPDYPQQPQEPYAQPGYQQPNYPQQPYPQPGYQQPGYPQPNYPQQPGYPQLPYPQYGVPAYPGAGYAPPGYPGQVSSPPTRPGSVTLAFAIWMLIMIISIASAVLLLTGDYYDEVQQALDEAALTGAESEFALQAGKTVLIVGGVISLAISLFIYLFFGLKMRAGRNWSRIVLTVLGGLSVLAGVAGNSLTGVADVDVAQPAGSVIFGWIAVLLAATAIVVMYLPDSNTYFRESKAYRALIR